jgi:hypothetical protein
MLMTVPLKTVKCRTYLCLAMAHSLFFNSCTKAEKLEEKPAHTPPTRHFDFQPRVHVFTCEGLELLVDTTGRTVVRYPDGAESLILDHAPDVLQMLPLDAANSDRWKLRLYLTEATLPLSRNLAHQVMTEKADPQRGTFATDLAKAWVGRGWLVLKPKVSGAVTPWGPAELMYFLPSEGRTLLLQSLQ